MITVFQLLSALILTIIIEGLVAYLADIRDLRNQIFIMCINCITNLSLNLILLLIGTIGSIKINIISMFILEIAIVFIEWVLFRKILETDRNKFKLSLLLNTISFLFGLGLFIAKLYL